MNARTLFTALIFPVSASIVTFSALPSLARGHHSHTGRHARAISAQNTQASSDKSLQPYLSGAYPHPRSRYTVLMDMNSGKVLYGSNPDTRREPASLTKIMTATLLLEKGKLDDTVVAPKEVVDAPESSLHLRPGERLSLEDLLYAMLLRSANDTPIAGASYLAGSTPKFVDLMNQKAIAIGCVNTHFVTPNGLFDPNHYSTAHDLALMARYATLNLPMFNEIVKTQRYRIHRSIDKGDSLVVNTASSYLKDFPGADGIKTGYISQAGHCFVGSATRGGWRLIAVSLNSPKCREDVMEMLSYGFAHFQPVLVTPQGTSEGTLRLTGSDLLVPVATAHDLSDVTSKDHPQAAPTYTTGIAALPASQINLPIHAGDRVGIVTLYANGKSVATTDAVATRDVSAHTPVAAGMNLHGTLSVLGKIAVIILASLVAISFMALIALKLYAGAPTKNPSSRRARLTAQVRTVD